MLADADLDVDAREGKWMAERDEVGRSLCGHDSRDLRGRERVALGQRAKRSSRVGAHRNPTRSDRPPTLVGLAAYVDHLDAALGIDVAETLISRHFRQGV
jgi:hypothetical protein